MPNFIYILLLFLLPSFVIAQEDDPVKLEELLETISEESDVTVQLDVVEALIQNPINLKKATIEDIVQIPGISLGTAENIIIIARRKTTMDIREIADEVNLSDEQFYLLSICTYIKTSIKRRKKYNFYARTRSISRLTEIYGFVNNKFQGSKLNLYQRYNAYFNGISAGILIDKDEGETKLNDFTSGYLSLEYFGSKLVVGDYYLEIGMGNLFWKNFGMRKGAEVILPALQYGTGIEPYRSSIESNFFRGVAVESNIPLFYNNSIKIKWWFSNINRAATIDENDVITSLYQNGYFRTATEITKKNAVSEEMYGANLEWQSKYFSLGVAGYRLAYDKPIKSSAKSVFYGKDGILGTVYAFSTFSDYSLGGEISRDANNNIGIKAGSQIEKKDYSLAVGFRSFDNLFRSPFGYNFGEQSYPANETGFYFSGNWKKHKTLSISAYLDMYKSKEQTYSVPFGLRGLDMFSEIWWKPHRKTELRLRLRYEDKSDSHTDYEKQQILVYQKVKPAIRFDARHNVNSKLFFRFRTEVNSVLYEKEKPDEAGYMCFFEFSWEALNQVKFGGRASLFSTDSYSSAIWQFEYAMPGYMTTVPLYGKGSRYYLFLRIKPIENIILSLRTSYTKKNNRETLGSGYFETTSNEDLRLYIQLDLRF